MGTHNCVADRCDTDPRTAIEVEQEGYEAGCAGISYDDCPYGHSHPDVRFNPWQRGRWKVLGEWCARHHQPTDWCETAPPPAASGASR